ncbi:MAG: glycosyltransferase family 4 protein [Bradymonadia bacterium]
MRIALTTNFSPWSPYSGGGQRSTHQLASALAMRGHEVTVVYTRAPFDRIVEPDNLPYQVRWAAFFGARSSRQAPFRPLNAISVRREIESLFAEKRLDVVHCQGEEGALIPRLRSRLDFSLVVTPRYPWYPTHLKPNGDLLSLARLWVFDAKYPVLGKLIHGADWVCPTSTSAAHGVQGAYGVSESKIRVIPNGINERFWNVRWDDLSHRDEVLFYGRLAHDKGVDVLLKALRPTQLNLHVIGRGDQEIALKDLARRLGVSQRVRWTDWCDPETLADEVASSSLVVLPSRHESFGNVMAETLAIGTPLISTNTGSIPEVVGPYAELINVDDVEGLTTAMTHVHAHSDEVKARAAEGREWVRSRYHWDEVAARFEEVYAVSRV